jgi:hypothetical protein
LLNRLTLDDLLVFRTLTGHAVLDKPKSRIPAPRSTTGPIPGRLLPAPPHDSPSEILPRGTWSRHHRRDRSRPP